MQLQNSTVLLEIGDEQINSLSSIELLKPKTTGTLEFTHKRKNKFFFKSQFGKVMIESNEFPEDFKKLKKGQKFEAEWG